MANRILVGIGNVIIVDSAMGNSVLLTSANMAINMSNLNINAIGFYSIDTTGIMILSAVNTTDIVFRSGWNVNGAGGVYQAMQWFPFNKPMKWENLKVPTLTSGTGFIYLA